jgi:hypothetical protein
MEFFRTAANPWRQNVLLGIAWDLMWVAIIAGAAFVVVHAIYVGVVSGSAEPDTAAPDPGSIPERLERQVTGIQFAWVTIHWIAGMVLLLAVLYHVFHATLKQDFWAMWIGRDELAEGVQGLRGVFRRSADLEKRRGAKYPLDHKLYHHVVAIVGIAAIVSGVRCTSRSGRRSGG